MIRVSTKQIDAERDQLEKDRLTGVISNAEYNKAMRDIDREQRDAYREAAEQNAEEAYRNTMNGDW